MPTTEHKKARRAIAAIMQAAANPNLTDEQAMALFKEARKNAELTFGPSAAEELTRMVVQQVCEFYESRIVVLEEIAHSVGLTLDDLRETQEE